MVKKSFTMKKSLDKSRLSEDKKIQIEFDVYAFQQVEFVALLTPVKEYVVDIPTSNNNLDSKCSVKN